MSDYDPNRAKVDEETWNRNSAISTYRLLGRSSLTAKQAKIIDSLPAQERELCEKEHKEREKEHERYLQDILQRSNPLAKAELLKQKDIPPQDNWEKRHRTGNEITWRVNEESQI